jgi:hypothetical protein
MEVRLINVCMEQSLLPLTLDYYMDEEYILYLTFDVGG